MSTSQPRRLDDPTPESPRATHSVRDERRSIAADGRVSVGTLVGESTCREFRLALARNSVREQDIIAVDVEEDPSSTDTAREPFRIWAKVQRIERINPLFPAEAGHELAATGTDPLDTVLSLSREMVTAVCRVIGAESPGRRDGKLDQLRYPPRPASSAYNPDAGDIGRVVMGDLDPGGKRSIDIAVLSTRPDVDVTVDGHAIVTRHLAILAMTGAGKSVTARRIVEQIARRNYPIVVFDPHGDMTGLSEVPELRGRVRSYYARLPIFEQTADAIVTIVQALGRPLAPTHQGLFEDLFSGVKAFYNGAEGNPVEMAGRTAWLSDRLRNPKIKQYGIKPDLFLLADFAQVVVEAGWRDDAEAVQRIIEWTGCEELRMNKQTSVWLQGLPRNIRNAAYRLHRMEEINRKIARTNEPLPTRRTDLVRYGEISIVALAGYTNEYQSAIYTLVAEDILNARISGDLALPALFVLEEAHNLAPSSATNAAEEGSVSITRQIAQEGRKFGVGLLLVSQRPSRLDATTLSQCNSFVVMRIVNPADQQFVRQVVETLGEDEVRLLPDLDVGEAILSGQIVHFPVLVRIKLSESRGDREEKDAFEALEEARIAANSANRDRSKR